MAITIIGIISLVYLLNPTAGFFELIPDNIPFLGNLDEATACALILAVFRYFGFDLTGYLLKSLDEDKPPKNDL